MTDTLPPAARRAGAAKELEIGPREVKAWVEALPLSRTVEASRKLRDHLRVLQRASLGQDDLAEVLEICRPVVLRVLEDLDAMYASATLPLQAPQKEALGLARELARELAMGYSTALNEAMGRRFRGKKQLSILVYRSLEFLATELRTSYRAYSPVPRKLWRTMHKLYLHADAEAMATEPIEGTKGDTIERLYCESLLIALTDPYRLSQGELDRVVDHIRKAAAPVAIGQAFQFSSPRGHFLVPCDLDKPPKPAISGNADRGGPNWRLLDANPLVEKLRSLRLLQGSRALSAPESEFVARLVTFWGEPPKRASRRDPMETSVAICVGLKAAAHFLSLERKFDPAKEAEAIRSGLTLPLISVPSDEDSKVLGVNEWEVVNQSKGGLKVRRAAPGPQPIGVGEVVGIKFLGRARWTLGVARWITVLDEGGLEFGIQFLAPAGRAISLQPLKQGDGTVLLALLLESDVPGGKLTGIVAPTGTYADLRLFELEEDGAVSTARAMRLVEKTARIEHFEVVIS